MVFAYVNFIGHRNILPQQYTDLMMKNALEAGVPEVVLDMFRFHSELLYHPHPQITANYFKYFDTKDFEALKKFFLAVKGNYMLTKPVEMH